MQNLRNSMVSFQKRIAGSLLILVLLLPFGIFVTPRTAHAQWAVVDIPQTILTSFSAIVDGNLNVKELILDPLVTMAARVAIQSLMRSVINWANNGFEGSPAFVDDLERNLQGLGDAVADGFIAELGLRGYVNSPFRDVVMRELRASFRRSTSDAAFFERSRYNLDQYSDDPAAFQRGNFSRGGVRAWIHSWLSPYNNPGGALTEARAELDRLVARATDSRMTQLGWNNGVLSWCGPAPRPPTVFTAPIDDTELGQLAQQVSADIARADIGVSARTALAPRVVGCQPGQAVRTPGSLIHSRIEKSLGSDIDMLVSADEIDEMVGAVLNGLVNKMLGGEGFAGLSRASAGGGPSPVDQAGAPDQIGVSPGNAGGGYTGVVSGQIDELKRFRADWETLHAVALRAQARCEVGDSKKELVDGVVSQSEQKIASTTEAITTLTAIQAKLATGTGAPNQTQLIREGTEEYQAFMALRPSRMPSVEDITFIRTQIQTTPVATEPPPDGTPPQATPTLYMQMLEIADAPTNIRLGGILMRACGTRSSN